MIKSLAIVLPIFNGEATLRNHLENIFEVTSTLTEEVAVWLIDDGSSDDTYEIASEMANKFPQIYVSRNNTRVGLGPILEKSKKELRADVVFVHDGVSRIDAEQIRQVWLKQTASQKTATMADELASITSVHDKMALAHNRMNGFQLVKAPLTVNADSSSEPPATITPTEAKPGVGQIPPLPRPNFLNTMSDFAFGE